MSASEKLKALEAKAGSYPKSMTTTGSLLHALPQIVAVVEEAERVNTARDDCPTEWWEDLVAALRALEEALT